MIILLNRLPVPNLKWYSGISFSLLLFVLIHGYKIFYDLTNSNSDENSETSENSNQEYIQENGYFLLTLKLILFEPWCSGVLINFCYCGILVFSKFIQGIIFGKLRVIENQHIKDQFWNFIFLKFIFLFGVLNLENLIEIIKWSTWFSAIGFLSIHCQICKDRFEYLSFSTSTPFKSHGKILGLLLFIQISCSSLVFASLFYMSDFGFNTGLFLFAESFGLFLRNLYVISKYIFHLCDVNNLVIWKNKNTITYYMDFLFEMAVASLDFTHYMHMLVYGNFYLSMASLVICIELKRLFIDIKQRIRRHTNYLHLLEKMEKKYPWANKEELDESDKCAVCWETLDKARRLPCSHIFHQNCLRSWLEQDTSCPICRKSLQDNKENQTDPNQSHFFNPDNTGVNDGVGLATPNLNQLPPQQLIQRSLFHFNGSNYVSWLPSFSLHVTNGTHNFSRLVRPNIPLPAERLNEMSAQVSQMFAYLPIEVIQQDLLQTHSVEHTIENILEDRLTTQRNDITDLPEDSTINRIQTDNQTSSNTDLGEHRHSVEEIRNIETSQNGFSNEILNGVESNQNINTEYSAVDSELATDLNQQSSIYDDSNINAKYKKREDLSMSANSLIERKRELILNSKRRFLEKLEITNKNKKSNEIKKIQGSNSQSGDAYESEQTEGLRHRIPATENNL